MATFDLPTTPATRAKYMSYMYDMNKKLILDLYGSEHKWLTNKTRVQPLESWILRYDRVMGYTPDVLVLADEIGFATTGDARVELYGELANRVVQATSNEIKRK